MSTRKTTALLMTVLLLVAAGCGGITKEATGSGPHRATSSAPAPSAYVTEVNRLCEELVPKVTAVTAGQPPTMARFTVHHPQLAKIVDEFDAQVAAVPATAADRPAVDAFDAFRHDADSIDARLLDAAALGDEARFDEALIAFMRDLGRSPALEDLRRTGISCSTR